MELSQPDGQVFCPDGSPAEEGLARTTHLAVCAHPDDIEILAIHGVLECFRREGRAFSGVVVTDGAGSARALAYKDLDDAAMREVRAREQKKAAMVGEYAAQVLLAHPSAHAKAAGVGRVVEDLARVIDLARPEVIYTHSPCDQHETHVGTTLRTIAALRSLPAAARPRRVIGCEVWGDLDWLPADLKVVMDVSAHDNLQAALLGVFDSQIASGKRYDLATLGRRKAHATFSESHAVDRSQGLIYGIDLLPLVDDPAADVAEFVQSLVERFGDQMRERLARLV